MKEFKTARVMIVFDLNETADALIKKNTYLKKGYFVKSESMTESIGDRGYIELNYESILKK